MIVINTIIIKGHLYGAVIGLLNYYIILKIIITRGATALFILSFKGSSRKIYNS